MEAGEEEVHDDDACGQDGRQAGPDHVVGDEEVLGVEQSAEGVLQAKVRYKTDYCAKLYVRMCYPKFAKTKIHHMSKKKKFSQE